MNEMERSVPARILVVEDEPDIEPLMRQKFRSQLQCGEFAFRFVRDGMEALEVLAGANDFDIVLTDLRMPRMDGLTLLGHLHTLSPGSRAVVISAYGDMENIRAAMNLGAFDFLTKPIDFQDVEITIYKTLRHVHELRESRRAVEYRIAKELAEGNLQRLEQLETLKESLTAMIVHDLRTPVTAVISGIRTVLALGPVNEPQRECLGITRQSAESILGLVNDLLDISKLEEGSLHLEYEPIIVAKLLQQVLGPIALLAQQKDQQLQVQSDPAVPLLYADKDKLGRALLNLLSNATKFTPAGGMIRLCTRLLQDGRLVFEIHDTGEGIPAAALASIFHKFGQVQSRKAGRLMSSGLGLTFSKMIAQAHGGDVEVSSELGVGSVFTMTVPLSSGP